MCPVKCKVIPQKNISTFLLFFEISEITHVDVLHPIDDASFFDTFDESVAGSVVCDGQSESIFALGNFNLLWSPLKRNANE
jgi:hypothetical protein